MEAIRGILIKQRRLKARGGVFFLNLFMNYHTWNCRGVIKRECQETLNSLLSLHNISLFDLLETHMQKDQNQNSCRNQEELGKGSVRLPVGDLEAFWQLGRVSEFGWHPYARPLKFLIYLYNIKVSTYVRPLKF